MIELKDFIFPVPVTVDENGCWIPKGWKRGSYLSIMFEGELWYCHRLAKKLNGIPDLPVNPPSLSEGICCHHCDNKHCSNPNHSYIGTASDNIRDAVERNPERWSNPETRLRMSESAIGRERTEESKRKQSESISGENHYNYGKKASSETLEKMKLSHIGIPNAMKGKKHSEQTLLNFSLAKKGKPWSDARRKAQEEKRK